MESDLQHVAAVERAGQLDALDRDAGDRAHRALDGLDLGPARLGAGARDHGEVAEHHDGVLDEHRVGELGRRVDLERLPALGDERGAVVVPLLVGERLVDRHALEDA